MGTETAHRTSRNRAIIIITAVSLFVNIIFALLKGGVGYWGNSQALIADAVHSLSDFFSDAVIIAGVLAASRPVDTTHRYGHGKFETLATAVLGILLFVVSVEIFISSGETLFAIHNGFVPRLPSLLVLIVAAGSIASKEMMYHLTVWYARKSNSNALFANAWHHRSDALSSVAVLVGSGAAYLFGGMWSILDPVAGIVVGIMVVKVAYDITKESVDELLERSLCNETEQAILNIIQDVPGALSPHKLRTRRIGSAIAVDIHVLVDPSLNIVDAHDIASAIEEAVTKQYGEETIVSVHTEPDIDKERNE